MPTLPFEAVLPYTFIPRWLPDMPPLYPRLSSSRIVLQVTCGGQENCQVCFPASVSCGCYWSGPERLHLHILVWRT